jgi:hypothetical protein
MSKAKVTFKHIVPDIEAFGSDDEHMGSRVFFDLEINGKELKGLYVDVKHRRGVKLETIPIEIGSPQGYEDPFNLTAFRDEAEKYYRSCLDPSLASDVPVFIKGVAFVKETICEFEVSEESN